MKNLLTVIFSILMLSFLTVGCSNDVQPSDDDNSSSTISNTSQLTYTYEYDEDNNILYVTFNEIPTDSLEFNVYYNTITYEPYPNEIEISSGIIIKKYEKQSTNVFKIYIDAILSGAIDNEYIILHFSKLIVSNIGYETNCDFILNLKNDQLTLINIDHKYSYKSVSIFIKQIHYIDDYAISKSELLSTRLLNSGSFNIDISDLNLKNPNKQFAYVMLNR